VVVVEVVEYVVGVVVLELVSFVGLEFSFNYYHLF